MRATDDVEQWLKEPTHQRLLADLVREPADTLEVFLNGAHFVCAATKELDALVPLLIALRQAVESVARAPEPPLDVSMLPQELGSLVQQFEALAEGDDELRGEMRAHLTTSRKAKFLRIITPLLPALNGYLDSVSEPWPDAAIKLGQLGEFASELLIQKPRRS
jgi:hypothetical protein